MKKLFVIFSTVVLSACGGGAGGNEDYQTRYKQARLECEQHFRDKDCDSYAIAEASK